MRNDGLAVETSERATEQVDQRPQPEIPTPTIEVGVWTDPVVDTLGFDPRSDYVERCWLPVLGPSTVLFLRRVADALDRHPDGFTLDLLETAHALGVGMRGGKNAPMLRTIERSCRFGAVRHQGPGAIAVRRRLAPLTRSQAERLPPSLRTEHERWLAMPRPSAAFAELQERARATARTLIEQGTPVDEVERRLHSLRFHPALAHATTRWAHSQTMITSDWKPSQSGTRHSVID